MGMPTAKPMTTASTATTAAENRGCGAEPTGTAPDPDEAPMLIVIGVGVVVSEATDGSDENDGEIGGRSGNDGAGIDDSDGVDSDGGGDNDD